MKDSIDGIQIRALLSRNLKRLRSLANISQTRLADEADLAPNFINDIESGKKWPSSETMAKLSKALKVEPCLFFLSDYRWGASGPELASLYLDAIGDANARTLSDLRSHFVTDSHADSPEDKKPKNK